MFRAIPEVQHDLVMLRMLRDEAVAIEVTGAETHSRNIVRTNQKIRLPRLTALRPEKIAVVPQVTHHHPHRRHRPITVQVVQAVIVTAVNHEVGVPKYY